MHLKLFVLEWGFIGRPTHDQLVTLRQTGWFREGGTTWPAFSFLFLAFSILSTTGQFPGSQSQTIRIEAKEIQIATFFSCFIRSRRTTLSVLAYHEAVLLHVGAGTFTFPGIHFPVNHRGLLVGNLIDWEKVGDRPLGHGGQSMVYLVRNYERKLERHASASTISTEHTAPNYETPGVEIFAKAIVNLAREDRADELAALKMFIPRDTGPESATSRLHNEIEVLKIKHEGFLKLLDYNEAENWIVTEYCENGTLDRHFQRFKGKALESLLAFLPLVRTVASLHENEIVHRDIKPQNIFMGSDHELLLGDFGLVFLPDQTDRISGTGESVGPRDFMPPWIFLDEMPGPIKPNFDVYMLGKVLWCMVSGRMRLPREAFLEPRFDLTRIFPGDPGMHAINFILKRTVVAEEKDCKPSASELLEMIEGHVQVMQRGGQMLRADVPRFCRVCGQGQYHPELHAEGQAATTPLQFNKVINGVSHRVGGFTVEAFGCDRCGHIQFFKAGQLRNF